jgi:hypothetical protein
MTRTPASTGACVRPPQPLPQWTGALPIRRLLDRLGGFSLFSKGLQLSAQILPRSLGLFSPAAFLNQLLLERGLRLL